MNVDDDDDDDDDGDDDDRGGDIVLTYGMFLVFVSLAWLPACLVDLFKKISGMFVCLLSNSSLSLPVVVH